MNRMLFSCTCINGLIKVVCGKKLRKIAILNTKNPFFYKSLKPEVDGKTTSGYSILRFSRYDRNTMSIRRVQTCKYNGKSLNWIVELLGVHVNGVGNFFFTIDMSRIGLGAHETMASSLGGP